MSEKKLYKTIRKQYTKEQTIQYILNWNHGPDHEVPIVDYRWMCAWCGYLNWVIRTIGRQKSIYCSTCSKEHFVDGTYFSYAECFIPFKELHPEKFKEIQKERRKNYKK